MRKLYLDANAHVPMNSKSIRAFCDVQQMDSGHGHPSSLSFTGREASILLEESREKIAELIGAKNSNQIIFTLGCTQAAEWGLDILFSLFSNLSIGVSPLEHPAVRSFCDKKTKQTLNVSKNGEIFNYGITVPKVGVCIHTHNEFGVIQNWFKEKKFEYLFSDMSQTLGKYSMNDILNYVDVGIFGAHKFGGPASVGFMYLNDSSWWKEFGTGSRYYLDRPGTPDVAGIYATSIALEESLNTLNERMNKAKEFQLEIEPKLEELGAKIICKDANLRSPFTTFIRLPKKCLQILIELSNQGISVGLGSACGSVATGISPSIKAIGEFDKTSTTHDYMRISQFGEYGKEDGKYFMDIFSKILKNLGDD